MLADAGLVFDVAPADVDEEALKTPGVDPVELARTLAEAKALEVSSRFPGAVVLGGDRNLAFDGGLVSKAKSLEEARARLRSMRGRAHALHSGAALAQDGRLLWSGADTAHMVMRDFSDAFLDDYMALEGEAVLASVGAYRLEGPGAQMFARVDGDYFTVLGLPLWSVLEALRQAGVLKP